MKRTMKRVTRAGIMFRIAWGRITWPMACRWVRPVEIAACTCPSGTDWIPARTISAR